MADSTDILTQKLAEIAARYESLGAQLIDPAIASDHRKVMSIAKEQAALRPTVETYREYVQVKMQATELRSLINESRDAELVALAREEVDDAEARADELREAAQRLLLSAEDRRVSSIILEVRAGVGGDEAALWAGDLVAMYMKYAAARGWRFEEIQSSPGEQGGFKQAILAVHGDGVWSELGYEGGTHQVKRVPATEAQGRVHTSTATIAVMSEPEELELDLDTADVKEMITTAQGPGGQNVNKVATAVHLIHQPTGIEVRMQETKSQSQNREKAWMLLRARLYERQRAEQEAQRRAERRIMIGSGSRAEKIRTYRAKENNVVDHRLGSSDSFRLDEIMAGQLQPLIESLVAHDMAQRLAAL
jgi:peptide chain release factor 1